MAVAIRTATYQLSVTWHTARKYIIDYSYGYV